MNGTSFLTWALRTWKEVHLILQSKELLGSERVGPEELLKSVSHFQK
jgi:hypothetical protein